MSDYSGGLKILRKIAEDEKNWRAGMQQIGELLTAAEAAERTLRDCAQQEQALKASISRFTEENAALQRSIADRTKRLGTLDAELEAKAQPKREELAGLDRQIGEKKQQLAALKAELEAFRSRLTV